MMSLRYAVLICMAVSVYSYTLPPIDIGVPQKGDGICRTLNGEEVKVGESKAIDDCKLNCTCTQVEKNNFLECTPWCKVQRKVCNLGDKVEEDKYFEVVGDTGCKRCVSIVCDAFKFPQTPEDLKVKPMLKVNTQRHNEGPYTVFKEVEEVIVNPHPRKFP